jgi:rhodanese-related sulfurtransferase
VFDIREIDSRSLAEVLDNASDAVRLVDVRGPAEWAQGVIEGAELLPLHALPLRADEIPLDRPTVFYCRSGARSAQACAYMMSRGNGNVVNLRGGIIDWVREGLPLTVTSRREAVG